MQRPGFLCIGAAKAGTTTLHDILKQHPDIYLPSFKEAHFFDSDNNYSNGLDWYLKNVFKKAENQKVVGEITPSYLYFENVPERIFNTFGADMKFIVMLRNPCDRAYSQYSMHFERGNETLRFEDAVERENERIAIDYNHKIRYSYVGRGLYYKQLSSYLKYFPIENFLILYFEEFLADKEKYIRKTLDFLSVDYVPLKLDIKSNESGEARIPILNNLIHRNPVIKTIGKGLISSYAWRKKIKQFFKRRNIGKKNTNRKLDPELKKHLTEKYFVGDIKQLEKLTGKNLASWYS